VSYARLFGDRPWLADRETCSMLHKQLTALGLQEHLSDSTLQRTRLGKELNLDLQIVFMGLLEPYDMPYVLEAPRAGISTNAKSCTARHPYVCAAPCDARAALLVRRSFSVPEPRGPKLSEFFLCQRCSAFAAVRRAITMIAALARNPLAKTRK